MILSNLQLIQLFIKSLLRNKKSDSRQDFKVPNLLGKETAEGFVESFDGCEIYWKLYGPKIEESKEVPMVFCYGLVCSMNQWRDQVERYKSKHPCLLIDYRGHHKSSDPLIEDNINLSACAKDVSVVMNSLGIRNAHIWGHSMGASVALELAASEQNLCKSLILICAAVHNPFAKILGSSFVDASIKQLMKRFDKNKEKFYNSWHFAFKNPKFIQMIVQIFGFNRKAVRSEDIESYIQAVRAVHPKTFFKLLFQIRNETSKGIARKVKTPTFIVSGGRDLVTPAHLQQKLNRILENSEFFSVPLGSHNVQLEFGEYIAMKVDNFWQNHLS